MKFNIKLYYIIIYLCIFFMINAQINIVNIEINSKEIPSNKIITKKNLFFFKFIVNLK